MHTHGPNEQAREVKDIVRFATSRMPNFVERVSSLRELETVRAKAEEWGLPLALVLSSSGGTSSSLKVRAIYLSARLFACLPACLPASASVYAPRIHTKALSTEYRRRLIVAEHKVGKGSEVAVHLKVSSFPAVLGFQAGAGGGLAPARLEKEPTFNRLDAFFRKLALRKPVLKKPAKDAAAKEEL